MVDGMQNAGKFACSVWNRGKAGDYLSQYIQMSERDGQI